MVISVSGARRVVLVLWGRISPLPLETELHLKTGGRGTKEKWNWA